MNFTALLTAVCTSRAGHAEVNSRYAELTALMIC